MPTRHRKATKTPSAILRRRVSATLAASPAFGRLPRARQARLVRDAAAVAAFTDLAQKVEFPDFVAGLIAGVFDAILDASIRQMEAYAELVARIASAVDRFAADNAGDGGRDHLVETYPALFEICADGSLALRGQCPGAAQGRASRGPRRRSRRKAPTSAS